MQYTNVDKQILSYLLNNKNTPDYAGSIASEICFNKSGVTKRCKELKNKSKVLKSELKFATRRGHTDYYSLIRSVDVLKAFYEHVDTIDLMNSTYYQNMIPEIIDHFDTELQKQNLQGLSQFDRTQLTLYLKYTSSGLHFIFNPHRYKQTLDVFDRNGNINRDIIQYCAETVIKSLNIHQPVQRKLKETSSKIFSLIKKGCKIDELFRQFSFHDSYLNDITISDFNRDMDKAVVNFKDHLETIMKKTKAV